LGRDQHHQAKVQHKTKKAQAGIRETNHRRTCARAIRKGTVGVDGPDTRTRARQLDGNIAPFHA
jgi:hypothetical protein